ncbi:MAG: hypothetical protein MJ216_00370 [Bacilli bacterium]|nr:hypothetical protein [Bacilli bacterium]
MGRLFKAFLFKLKRDLTFRITLIIGAAFAVLMTFLFFLIDATTYESGGSFMRTLTGPNMFLNSISPVQNFGISIPVNLISFTCLEFTQGTIRNKIISGNSKLKIYLSLFLSGLVFTFALFFAYAGLCTLFGTIFGGFNLDDPVLSVFGTLGTGYVDASYLVRTLIMTLLIYVTIAAFTIFISATFRSIGPSIPIVIVVLMIAFFSGFIFSVAYQDNETLITIMKVVNPLYGMSAAQINIETGAMLIDDSTFICSIVCNLVYTVLFTFFGALIFTKKDVK